jgi:predicted MFS family arabinose efflux permease
MFNGIFYAAFQMTQVSGDLISMIILNKDDASPSQTPSVSTDSQKSEIDKRTSFQLFMAYVTSCIIGIIVMQCMVRPLKPKTPKFGYIKIEKDTFDDTNEESSCHILASTLSLIVKPRLFLLIPLMLVNGLEMGFAYSTLTENVIKKKLGESNIGLGMVCFGLSDTLSSILFGKISDKIGIPICIFLGFLLQTLCAA